MNIEILPSAVVDLRTGRQFYGAQGEDVGEYFYDSLLADIDSLILYAGIHERHFGYYRLLSHRFPYAVYYKIEKNAVVVWRILDLRRAPDRNRLALPPTPTTP